ncbi:MAG TPA: hypothetical protein VEU33_29450 [Archangium sp.]|nr:hypothetical protein [Archangium sp.]
MHLDCTTPGDDDGEGETNGGTVCVCVPHTCENTGLGLPLERVQ